MRGTSVGIFSHNTLPVSGITQHNSHIDADVSLTENETEDEKRARRAAKYEASKQELLKAADAFADRDSRWVLHAIFKVTRPQMENTNNRLRDMRLSEDELSPEGYNQATERSLIA